jgi:multisubunit Na+/H+ antiporter MnhB subunit
MNIVFGAAGAICLLIIVMAGLRYTMSQDNPQETARAKNQIIYALVGLVVVLTAASIINFVLKSVVGA